MKDYDKLMKQLEAYKSMQGQEQEIPFRPEDTMTPDVDTSAKTELIQQPTTNELRQLATPERDVASVIPDQEIKDVNQDMKSDHLKTKDERDNESNSPEQEAKALDYQQEYKDLVQKYKETIDRPIEKNSNDELMNWITGIGGAANVLNRANNRNTPDVEYWNDRITRGQQKSKQQEIGELDKLSKILGNYKKATGQGNANKIFQTRSGLVQLDEKGKPIEIYQDPYMKSGAEVRKDSLDLRREKLKNTQSQKFQDDAAKAVDSLRKTDSWKDAEKSLASIPNIEVLLDDAYTNGGQSLSMLGPRIAKGIAGEVGVLTEQDVTRYVKNPELIEGLMDSLTKIQSGKLTESSYENIKRLLDISKQSSQDKMDTAVIREASLLSKREGIDIEEAYRLLDDTYKADIAGIERIKESKKDSNTDSDAPHGEEVERNGKMYKWNSAKKKYQLK